MISFHAMDLPLPLEGERMAVLTLSGCSLPLTGTYEGSLFPTMRQRHLASLGGHCQDRYCITMMPALDPENYPLITQPYIFGDISIIILPSTIYQ